MEASNSPRHAQKSMVKGLIAYSIICMLVIVVVVSLRFYIRLRVIRKFGNDDAALAATVFAAVCAVFGTTYATRVGLGTRSDAHTIDDRSTLLKLIFVSSLGYHVSIMLLKSTFLLQFRRVFPLPTFQRLCDIFLAFLAAWGVAGLIGGITICLPLSKNWDPLAPIWTCEKRFWFWMGHGIAHVITDVLIFIMPMPLLKTLPLPPLNKVVLIGVFSLGFLTCVISALRLLTLRASLQGPDVGWASGKTVFWSLGEVMCSIICLCIPTLRPLIGSCCAHRPDNCNIMERGTQRFGFYATNLPSTVDAPSPVGAGPGGFPSSNQGG